jgi:formiminotetrahydrofolate cyclodeaminase
MEEASIVATKAPLETAKKAFETLERLEALAHCGHKNCISDAGVSAYCAFAALQSAVMNVRINLGGISDNTFTSEAEALCVRLLAEAEDKTNNIAKVVYERL